MPSLTSLGWNPALSATFEPLAAAGLVAGRVALEHNHVYRVLTGQGEVLAEAAGRIKYEASGRRELPAVGDWVGLRPEPAGDRWTIRAILPRRSWFSRKAAGRGTEEQVLAANVDVVLLVFGLDKPVNPRAIERYVAGAGRSGAQPVVVLTKADLATDIAAGVAEAVAAAGGAPVVVASTKGPPGLASVEAYLVEGRTLALLGPSGAGKSSLVNALVGTDVVPTGDVRDWDRRGRHTSVHRQMVVRPAGGLIVDTPGLRELQLWDADTELGDTFQEIAALSADCKFRDCQHDREPGCAVKRAVAHGRLAEARYDNFLKLQHEQAALDKLRDERALLEQKRQTKIQHKALKSMQKSRGR